MIKSNPNGDLAAELTMLMSQRIAELEAEKTTLEHQVMRDGIAASNRTQRLVDRVNELEAENERLNTLLHKASQKSAEDFAEYVEEARMQAALECVEIMWKLENQRKSWTFGTCDLVRTSYAAAVIRNHFGL